MSVNNSRFLVDYGLTNALQNVFPAPIVSKRTPTTKDFAQIGQLWVQPINTSGVAQNMAWILTSIIANSATWVLLETGGGAGVFTALTVNPGPTNLSTVGVGAVTIGNSANTAAITVNSGSGGVAVNGNGNSIGIGNDAAANLVTVGSTTNGALTTIQGGNGTGVGSAAILLQGAAAGDIQVGAANQTGAVYISPSTAGNITNIANGNMAGSGTVNILSGVATGGTQTLNLGAGNSAKVINVGTGSAVANNINLGGTGANVIAIGNLQTGGSITLGGAMTTGTIQIGNSLSGLVSVPGVSVSSGTTTVVNNIRVGQAVYTGQTTAAGSSLVLTLTNSFITTTCMLHLSAANQGTNDAEMTIYRILKNAGSATVTLHNNGAAALNGDVHLDFWVTQ